MKTLQLVTLLLITACGAEDKSEIKEEGVEGKYIMQCSAVGEKSYAMSTITFTATTFKKENIYSDKSDCSDFYYQDVSDATYTLGDKNASLDGAKDLDVKYTSIKVMYKDNILVIEANKQGLYGYTDWVNGVAKEALGKPYSKKDTTKVTDASYSFLAKQSNGIVFGKGSNAKNGETKETRANVASSLYVKQ